MADNKKSTFSTTFFLRTIEHNGTWVLKTGDCQSRWAAVLVLLAPITLLVITLSVPEYRRFCWEISGFQMNHSPLSQIACRTAASRSSRRSVPLLFEEELMTLSMSLPCAQQFVTDITSVRTESWHFFPPHSCSLYQWFTSRHCVYRLVFNLILLIGIYYYAGKTMQDLKLKGKQVNHWRLSLILVNDLDWWEKLYLANLLIVFCKFKFIVSKCLKN